MRIEILGTGDTVGTPRVGCNCENCLKAVKTGTERLRTSMLISSEGKNVLIDTSPDLRYQLLKSGSPHIDAVLWTHAHYDHIAGYNEFYRVQDFPPAYGPEGILSDVSDFFHFLKIDKNYVQPYEPFELFGVTYTFGEVYHPPVYTCGILMQINGKKIGYTADTAKNIPKRTKELFRDCDMLFLDALMPPGIHIGKHMNYDDAAELAAELGAKEHRFIHLSHRIPSSWKNVAKDGEIYIF